MLHSHLDLEASIRQFGQSQTETAVWLEKIGVGISPEAPSVPGTDKWQETTCMVVRFRGSHQEAPAPYKTLLQFIRIIRSPPLTSPVISLLTFPASPAVSTPSYSGLPARNRSIHTFSTPASESAHHSLDR